MCRKNQCNRNAGSGDFRSAVSHAPRAIRSPRVAVLSFVAADCVAKDSRANVRAIPARVSPPRRTPAAFERRLHFWKAPCLTGALARDYCHGDRPKRSCEISACCCVIRAVAVRTRLVARKVHYQAPSEEGIADSGSSLPAMICSVCPGAPEKISRNSILSDRTDRATR